LPDKLALALRYFSRMVYIVSNIADILLLSTAKQQIAPAISACIFARHRKYEIIREKRLKSRYVNIYRQVQTTMLADFHIFCERFII